VFIHKRNFLLGMMRSVLLERIFQEAHDTGNLTSSLESLCLLRFPSSSVHMDRGYLDRGPCLQLIIHNFCHIHCTCLCNFVMIHSGHMTSIAPVHPGEGSSSVALLNVSSLFFL